MVIFHSSVSLLEGNIKGANSKPHGGKTYVSVGSAKLLVYVVPTSCSVQESYHMPQIGLV